MSTIKDFKNAPFGATATRADGSRVMKMDNTICGWITPNGLYVYDEQMEGRGYTLDLPTTAREAIDLTWELAHEVKPGQVIPTGARYLENHNSGLREYTALIDFEIDPELAIEFRTVEPLPDPEPEPDWLDAPAVLARLDAWNRDERAVFVPTSTLGRWTRADTDWTYHWHGLRDVTPLYPLAEGTLDGTEAPKGYTPKGQDA